MPSIKKMGKRYLHWGFLILLFGGLAFAGLYLGLSVVFAMLSLALDPLIITALSIIVSLPLTCLVAGYVAFKCVHTY